MYQIPYKKQGHIFLAYSFQFSTKQTSIMKGFLASLLALAVSSTQGSTLLEQHSEQFRAFKLEYGKTYMNQVEEDIRFLIFSENVRRIEEHNTLYNQGLISYKKEVTQFADMNPREFKAMLNLQQNPVLTNIGNYIKKGVHIPASVDWRSTQVTSVKSQGSCGSCWAFSVIGSTEGAHFRKSGKLVSLSPQQLVDCATGVNHGCNGGSLDRTFPYVKIHGLQSDESYPYKAKPGYCKYNTSAVITKVSSFVSIRSDEVALLEAVATIGPVSVAIDASDLSFYKSGVFNNTSCNPRDLNHGVLIVGYGIENGTKYWVVKNTWGTQWGENGFFRILRGSNHCGIAEDDIYPVID